MGGQGAGLFGQPSGPSLNMTVNVGKPSNPLAGARDNEWQKALRESLLVAHAQGFRVA